MEGPRPLTSTEPPSQPRFAYFRISIEKKNKFPTLNPLYFEFSVICGQTYSKLRRQLTECREQGVCRSLDLGIRYIGKMGVARS